MRKLSNRAVKSVTACTFLLTVTMMTALNAVPVVNAQQQSISPSQQRKEDENFLDLTKYSPSKPVSSDQERTASGTINVGGGSGTRVPDLPIRITLLSLDKRSYKLGDESVFDVALENISKEAVQIPWSPDSSIGSPFNDSSPPGNLLAVISLVVGNKTLGEYQASTYGLYGSRTVPGSLKTLQPGQRVRIRVPGRWQFYTEEATDRLSRNPGQELSIKARIFMADSNSNPPRPATSVNSLLIKLNKG